MTRAEMIGAVEKWYYAYEREGLDDLPDHQIFKEVVPALRGWVKTADKKPTEEDGGFSQEVMTATIYPCSDGDGFIMELAQVESVQRHGERRYTYWMQIPELPGEKS